MLEFASICSKNASICSCINNHFDKFTKFLLFDNFDRKARHKELLFFAESAKGHFTKFLLFDKFGFSVELIKEQKLSELIKR
jgi:hypothetical protein